MSSPFRTSRRIEFRDTDAAGIAHFSVFVGFMEEAEHEMLRHLGLSVVQENDQGKVSWPRVSVQCDFRRSVKFEDVVDIDVRVTRLGGKSVTYGFDLSHRGLPVATGAMTAVCCQLEPGQPPRSIPIPEAIREKLLTQLAPQTE